MDPSGGTGSVPLEAIIQQAVALGMQPQQLLQLLSNPNSAAQQNPALLLAQQQALVNQQAAALAAAQQQQAQVQAQQRQKAEQQQPMMTSLAWPEQSPAVQIPHFDTETYKRVNIDIPYSAIPSGMDLPINNVDTLRFFFNFGVCQARAILEKLATRGNNSQPLPQNLTNSALLKSITLQAAAQEQRGAFAGMQQQTPQSAVAQQMQAALSNPSASMSSLQQSLIQHMNRIGAAAGQSQTKMNDMTEAMMLQSALMNPSLAQLRSQSSAGHVLMPPTSLAGNIQNQLGGLQASHPLEHELIRPTPVNHLATVAAAAVASAASNVSSIATNLQAHAALNAIQRSSNASTPNTILSTAGSISAGTPMSNGGVLNSSSPKVSIPVDPAPRKPSTVAGHSEITDLQQRGLMALRSPSLMSEGLQRSLAAVDAAYNSGNAINVTSNIGSTVTTSATEHQESNTSLNDKITAPLGAQLSAALYQSFIGGASGDNRSGTQTPTTTTGGGNLGSSNTSTGMGGIGIAGSINPGGKSITTGSSGVDQKTTMPLGYPSVMEVDGGPTILQASEIHYTETLKKNSNFLPSTESHSSPQAESRRKSGLYAITSEVKEEKKDVKVEKPERDQHVVDIDLTDDEYMKYFPVWKENETLTAAAIRSFISLEGKIQYSLLRKLCVKFYTTKLDGDVLRRLLCREKFSLTPKVVFQRHPEYLVDDLPDTDFLIIKKDFYSQLS
ncbi:hypothetical protein FO519_005813 [Halicephalobus sp. NKZ332]|nr:hypothetical protein FO519_005813 [Halicephalobus sp. NKZ332]